ncbi:MAG: hypothetical protein H6Q74_1488 [Firmicutes bacterium]|nr:hypothetical protein [Bacillota bacterium]
MSNELHVNTKKKIQSPNELKEELQNRIKQLDKNTSDTKNSSNSLVINLIRQYLND